MASIKVKFRPSSVADREGRIYYQIIHERKVRHLHSGLTAYFSEWNRTRSMPVATEKNGRKEYLQLVRQQIRRDTSRLERIIKGLEASGRSFTSDDIIEEFNRLVKDGSVFNFMKSVIRRLKQNGQTRTSETYTATLHSFRNFRNNEDLPFDCLSSDIVEAYQGWMKYRGLAPNTISFYNRILRAVYNRAAEQGIVDDNHPFKHVYTGIDKTIKRALPISVLKRIRSLDLSQSPTLDYARDMFLMSFYLRGMSFIDMAFLRRSDLRNGRITYRRRKTGQRLIIEWTREMQLILDKYPENITGYLLPIIKRPESNSLYAYRNAGYRINYHLKMIARMAGVKMPLTLYVARHSWASAAKAKGIPLSIISEGMGHENEATTRIYLSSIDCSLVDKANSVIIRSLR